MSQNFKSILHFGLKKQNHLCVVTVVHLLVVVFIAIVDKID